jgi:branched-chain amino acid transport system ATP-binding protein
VSLLSITSLNKRFGGLHAVNDVSFGLEKDSIQAVIGPNGAGKTSLFNLISGAIPPDSGTVKFKDRDITGLAPHRIARHGIIRTFQALKLSASMTALENVMLGPHRNTKAGFASAILSLPRAGREEKIIREKARSAMATLGIEGQARALAGSLPFGTQRAVEMARALAAEPELLLLDEPASGLNMRETRELAELIQRIRDSGVTILIVEHDMSLVMGISDRVVALNFGRKIAEGTPREIQANPDVVRIYLGEEDA